MLRARLDGHFSIVRVPAAGPEATRWGGVRRNLIAGTRNLREQRRTDGKTGLVLRLPFCVRAAFSAARYRATLKVEVLASMPLTVTSTR